MELLRRIAAWWHARRNAADLQAELEAHRAHAQDELERAGHAALDAATESRRRMGNVLLAREDSRDVWMVRWADRLAQHARYGTRALVREPLYALTAILTLALGCATTITIFSIVDSELWRPLPYSEPDRLLAVYTRAPAPRTDVDGQSLAEFLDWREALPGLQSVAVAGDRRRRVMRLDHAESVSAAAVTSNYFSTLGRTAVAGRVFTPADAVGANTLVLTNRSWTRLFDRASSAIGRSVLVDDQPFVIVGVVADDDVLGPSPDVFLPIDERPSAVARSSASVFGSIGRLADGATAAEVQSQLEALLARRSAADEKWRQHSAWVEDLGAFYTRLDARALYFFLAASVFVLVLAATNTAGLVLSRTLRRAPEFSLRGALGGGGGAIAGQLLVEAALLVIPACALGVFVAMQAVAFTGQVAPEDFLQRGTRIAVDLRSVALAGVVALLAVAAMSFVPLRLARRAGRAAIGSGARAGETPAVGRARGALLTTQVALTVVLLAGAGVFLKSFAKMVDAPLGFNAEAAWSARISLSGDRYADASAQRAFAAAWTERARAIPGVETAAVATSSPLMSGWLAQASDPEAPAPAAGEPAAPLRTIYRAVGAGYFDAIGTPIVEGRALNETDVPGAPIAAVVNQEFARRMFPGESPVGRRIHLAPFRAPVAAEDVVIVGVALDIKEISVNEVAFSDVYTSFAQHPSGGIELIVRGHGDDDRMSAALRGAAGDIEPAIPVTSVTPLSRRVYNSLQGARFNLAIVGGFAVAALLIAAIGIYGAMAFAVTARRREFGVRLALGAAPRELVARSLRSAGRIGVAGGICGLAVVLAGAYWLGDALYLVPGQHSGMLYQTRTTDPAALSAAVVGVIALALLAGLLPALRSSRVDPTSALRSE
jgi:predicted permease